MHLARHMRQVSLLVSGWVLAVALQSPLGHADSTTSTTRVTEQSNPATEENLQTTDKTEIQRMRVGPNGQQQTTQQAGTSGGEDSFERMTITRKQPAPPPGGMLSEAVGINPLFGILALSRNNASTDTRGVAGLTVDVNLLNKLKPTDTGKPYLGPTFGVLYSHLGTVGGDFFGLNGPSGNNNGTHLLLFPLNIKAGYTFSNVFRPSVHGGATLLYNNTQVANATPTGVQINNSSLTAHPNVGLDLELGLGQSISLIARPDWTITSSTTIFTASFGLVFIIS